MLIIPVTETFIISNNLIFHGELSMTPAHGFIMNIAGEGNRKAKP